MGQTSAHTQPEMTPTQQAEIKPAAQLKTTWVNGSHEYSAVVSCFDTFSIQKEIHFLFLDLGKILTLQVSETISELTH